MLISKFKFEISNSRDSRGYAFAVLMLAITLILIMLTAALPDIYTAAQREKEDELIFRGNQYARAIMGFHRQFGRYPNSIDELVKKTNGYRFLRQKFKDPMTKKGDWRLIHTNASGAVLDSVTMPSQGGMTGGGMNPNGGQSFNNQSGTGSFLGSGPQSGGGFGGFSGSNSQNQPGANAGQSTGTNQSGSSESSTSSSDSSNKLLGGFIVGVASTSRKEGIRVWNNKKHYNEWEFLGVPQAGAGMVIGQPTQPNQNPGNRFGLGGGGFGQQPPLIGPNNPQQ